MSLKTTQSLLHDDGSRICCAGDIYIVFLKKSRFKGPILDEEFRYLTSDMRASRDLTLNSRSFQNMTPDVRIVSKRGISALSSELNLARITVEALTIAFALNCGRLRIHDAKVIYEVAIFLCTATRTVLRSSSKRLHGGGGLPPPAQGKPGGHARVPQWRPCGSQAPWQASRGRPGGGLPASGGGLLQARGAPAARLGGGGLLPQRPRVTRARRRRLRFCVR